MSILIIEDDALIAMTIEATLAEAGYSVMGATASASQALKIAAERPPRIALVNIHLRDGSSGAELARSLKEQWGTTIVFLTGEPADSLEHREIAVGVLDKPSSDAALLAAVRIADRIITGQAIDRAAVPEGLKIF